MRSVLERATILSSVVFAPFLMIAAAAADEISPAVLEQLKELQRVVDEQQKIIDEQQRRLTKLERQAVAPGVTAAGVQPAIYNQGSGVASPGLYAQAGPVPPAPVAPVPVPPVAPSEPPEAAPPPEPPEAELEEERPEEIEKPKEELLLESGAVLLPAGVLQIEPMIDYTHTSSDRVNILGFTIFEAIVIGLIRVDEIERDVIRPTINARYGLTNRLQLETTVPGVYREDSEILGVGTAGQSEIITDNFDIGDVEIGAAYQLLTQREWIPGTVLRLRGRFPTGRSAFDIDTTTVTVNETQRTILEETPTGSGFYAVAPGVTFILRSDPVAFYGGGSYTVNLMRDREEFGEIDPGDTAEFFLGMNVALSDRVGMNLSLVDQITEKTLQNGEEQVGSDSNDARISLGGSYGLTPDVSILASASVGLTDESPDFVFTLSLPINFSLF